MEIGRGKIIFIGTYSYKKRFSILTFYIGKVTVPTCGGIGYIFVGNTDIY